MRDHQRIRVFKLADALVEHVYRATASFPRSERFGLTSQLRRAAVSVATNIVEGCARSSEAEYVRFLEIAYGSSKEVEYQIGLSARLGFIGEATASALSHQCALTAKLLCRLVLSLRASNNTR